MSNWNRASASQIKTFRSCNRKWFFESVKKMRPPSRNEASLNRGTAIHSIIEHYLLEGEVEGDDALVILMKNSIPFLDTLRATGDLFVEHSFNTAEDWFVDTSGFIDVIHVTPETLTVIDHKTTSDFRWMSSEEQLRNDPQAIIYCTEALRMFPAFDRVSFTHHYILTSRPSQPRFVTVSYTREELASGVAAINADEASMQQASTTEDALQVLCNVDACGMYGGCPFAGLCHDPYKSLILNDEVNKERNSMLDNLFKTSPTANKDLNLGPVVVGEPIVLSRASVPVVYINCVPVATEYTTTEVWLAEEQAEWERINRIDYMAQEFNKGPREIVGVAMIRFKKNEKPLPDALVINTLTPLGALLAARQSEFGCPIVTSMRA